MEEVIHYLDLKNQYYEKFFAVTTRFLEDARLDRWEDLTAFVDTRERILNILRSYDFKIAALFEELHLTEEDLLRYRPRVKSLFDRRTHLVQRIVAEDLELIGIIDERKSDAIGELRRANASHLPDLPEPVLRRKETGKDA